MTPVGFTGSRHGLNDAQRAALRTMMLGVELHHGDCAGADAQAHRIAREEKMRIVVHPPQDDTLRAWLKGDETREPLPYLKRNRAIVDETDYLIACPNTDEEQQRSGTWSTVRYARKKGKKIVILLPSGSALIENDPGWLPWPRRAGSSSS